MPRILIVLAGALLCFVQSADGQATGSLIQGSLSASQRSDSDGCEKVGECVACGHAEQTKAYCTEGGGYKQQWLCAPTPAESAGVADVVVYRPCSGENSVALWAVLKFEVFMLAGAAASLFVVHQRKQEAFSHFRGQVVGDRLGADHV